MKKFLIVVSLLATVIVGLVISNVSGPFYGGLAAIPFLVWVGWYIGRRRKSRDRCYVYIISDTAGRGPIKVGITSNLKRRLRGLQTGSPQKLRVEHSVRFKTRKTALQVEKRIHRRGMEDGHHRNGEWFNREFAPRARRMLRGRT